MIQVDKAGRISGQPMFQAELFRIACVQPGILDEFESKILLWAEGDQSQEEAILLAIRSYCPEQIVEVSL